MRRTGAREEGAATPHRHGQDELEHRDAQRGGVNEAPAGKNEVREGALAGVADGMLLVHVLVITATQQVLRVNNGA